MTNAIALVLALSIGGLIALDLVLYEGANLLFLSRKFLELLTWVAFWR